MAIFSRIASIIFLVAIATFSGGCAHVVNPKEAPEIGLDAVGPFQAGYSVQFINNQPDTTPKLFAGIGGHTYLANYNEWTQFYINQFSKELTKRNVTVSNESTNVMKVALSQFAYFQGFAVVRVNMTVKLESSDGKWFKVYEETDTSGWSMGRAFGSVVYHSIEKILHDREVIERMRVNPVVISPVTEGK
ncbi:MAG TPA: hypothetical protein VMB78_02755 [Dissulfurispiraceae bacterium]|nr:hypothetical protein [Dissulfurispiraceae bacterium]